MRRLTVPSLVIVLLAGCSQGPVRFNYPTERLVYPDQGGERAKLYIEFVNDMRPVQERQGDGTYMQVRFPADDEWDRPVSQLYYESLQRDLVQTRLIDVVPMRSQADYVLEVDLLRLGAEVRRSVGGYLTAIAAGAGLGYLVSNSTGGLAVGAVVGMGAIPVPARLQAVAEVRLRVFDRDHEPFWEKTCRGEVKKNRMLNVVARNDQAWVDEHLTVAVKRCNACLLGQLRQALLADAR